MDQKITVPTDHELNELAQRVVRIDSLFELHLNRKMKDDESDPAALQQLLDLPILKATDTYLLQSIGLILGRCLCRAIPELDWVMVEDEHGRSPAISYPNSSQLLFPMTMISTSIENGERVDVKALLKQTRDEVEKLKAQVG